MNTEVIGKVKKKFLETGPRSAADTLKPCYFLLESSLEVSLTFKHVPDPSGLNFRTLTFWTTWFFAMDTALCIVRCSVVSLASVHYKNLPNHDKNIPRHCQYRPKVRTIYILCDPAIAQLVICLRETKTYVQKEISGVTWANSVSRTCHS